MARARDGHADWYDEHIAAYSATATPLLLRLVGTGPGSCLDVGCGTGAHLAALADAGWSVVGVDASADQLRVARRRPGSLGTALVQADAAGLPFADGVLDLVVSEFTHTDVDDFAALAAETRRVLRPDGRFVCVGLHPLLHRAVGRAATSGWCPGCPFRVPHGGVALQRSRDRGRRAGHPRRVPAPAARQPGDEHAGRWSCPGACRGRRKPRSARPARARRSALMRYVSTAAWELLLMMATHGSEDR
jgi:SAM-dependent methyltransferase